MTESIDIHSMLSEERVFEPPADFSARVGGSLIPDMDSYHQLWQRSIDDPEGFWGEVASEFHWFKPWDRVLEWNCPDAK